MYHLWRGLDGRASAASAGMVDRLLRPRISAGACMPWPRTLSTTTKNSAVSSTMMNTITEVIQVSWRLVQVILRASARTSRDELHRG